MTVTKTNRELIKSFLGIMRLLGVHASNAEAMVSMMQSPEDMKELIDFTQSNSILTERVIMNKAIEIYDRSQGGV